MNCPRCEESALDERERDGVVIDVCRACRGLWLDRGELEKLIASATREFDELVPKRRDDTPPRGIRYRGEPRRKRRWYESLGELFD